MATLQDLIPQLFNGLPASIPNAAKLEEMKENIYKLDVEIRKIKTSIGPKAWEEEINKLIASVDPTKLATALYCVTYALSRKQSDDPVRGTASSFANLLLRQYVKSYKASEEKMEEKFDKLGLLNSLQPLLELIYTHYYNNDPTIKNRPEAMTNALNFALKDVVAFRFHPDEINNLISKEFVTSVQLQAREQLCAFQLKTHRETLIDQAIPRAAALAAKKKPNEAYGMAGKQEKIEDRFIKNDLELIDFVLKFLASKESAEFNKLYAHFKQRQEMEGKEISGKLNIMLNEIFLLNLGLLPPDKLSELALESGQQFLQTKNSRAGEDFTRLYIAAKNAEGMVDLTTLHNLADRVFQASPHLTPPESPVMPQSPSSSSSMSPSSSASVSPRTPSSPSLSKHTPAVERSEYRAAPKLNLPSGKLRTPPQPPKDLSSSSARISSSLPPTPSVVSPPPRPPKPERLQRPISAPQANNDNNNNDGFPPSSSNRGLKK